MEKASHLLVTYLLNSLWQVTLVLAMASLCAVLLRRVAANVRHVLWLLALALSVLLPLWSLPRFTVTPHTNAAVDSPDTTLRVTAVASKTTTRRTGFHLPTLSPLHAAPAVLWTVAGCYFAFLLYRATRLCRAGQRTRVLSRAASAPLTSGPLADIVQRYSSAVGLTRLPSVYLTDGIGPVTIGIRRPLLLVPAAFAESASEQEMASAVCHELAHIRRYDFLLNLICELLWLPISFHPVAALIKSRIDGTRELACDETAARLLSAPAVYARSLVSIARAMSSSAPVRELSYGQGLFDSKGLEERIMNLVGNRRLIRGAWAHALSAITITLLAAASVSAATFSVQVAKPLLLASAASSASVSPAELTPRPVTANAQDSVPAGVTGQSTIREFRLLDGGAIPDAQEVLAQQLQGSKFYRAAESTVFERVRAFYQENGYLKAQILERQVAEPLPAEVDISVRVNPGLQYRLKDIQFSGSPAVSAAELRSLFSLQSGEIFKPRNTREGFDAIRRLYESKGLGSVVPLPELVIDDESRTILLNVRLETEPPQMAAATTQSSKAALDPLFQGYQKMGDGTTPPRALYTPDPSYDPVSKAARIQGTAVLRVGVGSDGLVKLVRVERGGQLSPELVHNAEESVRSWRFEPALKDGQAVPAQVSVEVNFRLY